MSAVTRIPQNSLSAPLNIDISALMLGLPQVKIPQINLCNQFTSPIFPLFTSQLSLSPTLPIPQLHNLKLSAPTIQVPTNFSISLPTTQKPSKKYDQELNLEGLEDSDSPKIKQESRDKIDKLAPKNSMTNSVSNHTKLTHSRSNMPSLKQSESCTFTESPSLLSTPSLTTNKIQRLEHENKALRNEI